MAEFDFEQPVSMEKMRAFRLDRIDEQMRQDGFELLTHTEYEKHLLVR